MSGVNKRTEREKGARERMLKGGGEVWGGAVK